MTKAWLRDLEEKVQETADRLRELREENQKLTGQVGELETRLAAAPDPDESATWEKERQEIRGRVEKLVQHLEDLLAG